jgi:chemotaxis protein MotB
MKRKLVAITILSSFLLFSCVSSKKFKKSQSDYAELQTKHTALEGDLTKCNDDKAELARQKTALENDKAGLNTRISDLNKQIDYLKQTNTTVLKQMEDLSVVSSSQAENIRKSLENIGAKDLYIQDLQASLARKDSLNLALVMNLKGAVGNMEDQDINIKVEKGVVYIDISDKLLFKSGKYEDNVPG